jgi:dihydroflavonol-4-reductase
MKYLVTGATGFLGAHLVSSLREEGHEVVCFSRTSGGSVVDFASVRRAAEGCEGAFHCAGRVSRKPQDAEELYRVHVDGTKIVLDACEAAGIERVVIVSTSGTVAVSDDPSRIADETGPAPVGIIGRWPYYRAKLFAERAALARNGRGLEVVSVNPSLLLGPGDTKGSSTSDVRLFLERSLVAVPAGGISFVDVRDVAAVMKSAMKRGQAGERYLVGACNLTLRDFFSRLGRVSGVASPRWVLPRSTKVVVMGAAFVDRWTRMAGLPPALDPVTAEMAQYFWYLNAGKAVAELGFRPRDPNATLFDTVQDLRARGVVWPVDDAVERTA